jgi:hypothetical protein
MRLNFINNGKTTLTQSINSSVTQFTVADGTKLPTPPFRISINDEILEVKSKTGNTLDNVERGMEGTTLRKWFNDRRY